MSVTRPPPHVRFSLIRLLGCTRFRADLHNCLLQDPVGADEKHTRILGNKVYVATTVGSQCILYASIPKNAGKNALKGAYQIFKNETQCLKPDYAPTT